MRRGRGACRRGRAGESSRPTSKPVSCSWTVKSPSSLATSMRRVTVSAVRMRRSSPLTTRTATRRCKRTCARTMHWCLLSTVTGRKPCARRSRRSRSAGRSPTRAGSRILCTASASPKAAAGTLQPPRRASRRPPRPPPLWATTSSWARSVVPAARPPSLPAGMTSHRRDWTAPSSSSPGSGSITTSHTRSSPSRDSKHCSETTSVRSRYGTRPDGSLSPAPT